MRVLEYRQRKTLTLEKLRRCAVRLVLSVLSLLLASSTAMGQGIGDSARPPLHQAILARDREHIRELLDSGADIEAKGLGGVTPLWWAVALEDEETIRRLLSLGADPNAAGHEGSTPVHAAVERGRPHLITLLLAHGGNPDIVDRRGETPLVLAARRGRPDIAALMAERSKVGYRELAAFSQTGAVALLQRYLPARPGREARGSDGGTLLHVAAGARRAEVVRLLLSRGAEPKAKDAEGHTPLHAAVSGFASDPAGNEVIDLLIAAGANLETKDNEGKTPLHAAVSWRMNPAPGERAKAVRHLLAKGADPNARDGADRTPLHWAAIHDFADAAEALLESGAAIEVRDRHIQTDGIDAGGRTPLEYAVSGRRKKDVAALLISRGAKQEGDKGTVLHTAAEYADREVIALLLAAGADPNAWNDKGETPLHCAAKMGNTDAVEVLLGASAKVDAADSKGRTALHNALRAGQMDLVHLLAERGADVRVPVRYGVTPLHLAVLLQEESIVDLFLAKGADPNAPAQGDLTPLHLAALGSSHAIVSRLLAEGARVDAPATDGRTPLHVAVERSCRLVLLLVPPEVLERSEREGALCPQEEAPDPVNPQIVDALIAAGARPDAKDSAGETPLSMAVKREDSALLNHLGRGTKR